MSTICIFIKAYFTVFEIVSDIIVTLYNTQFDASTKFCKNHAVAVIDAYLQISAKKLLSMPICKLSKDFNAMFKFSIKFPLNILKTS